MSIVFSLLTFHSHLLYFRVARCITTAIACDTLTTSIQAAWTQRVRVKHATQLPKSLLTPLRPWPRFFRFLNYSTRDSLTSLPNLDGLEVQHLPMLTERNRIIPHEATTASISEIHTADSLRRIAFLLHYIITLLRRLVARPHATQRSLHPLITPTGTYAAPDQILLVLYPVDSVSCATHLYFRFASFRWTVWTPDSDVYITCCAVSFRGMGNNYLL
jgi:hypothetical protein